MVIAMTKGEVFPIPIVVDNTAPPTIAGALTVTT